MRPAQLRIYSTARHPVPRQDFLLCCMFRRAHRPHPAPVIFHLFHGVPYPPYAPSLSFCGPFCRILNYMVYSAFCGHLPQPPRHEPKKLKERPTGSVFVSGHATPTRIRNSSRRPRFAESFQHNKSDNPFADSATTTEPRAALQCTFHFLRFFDS